MLELKLTEGLGHKFRNQWKIDLFVSPRFLYRIFFIWFFSRAFFRIEPNTQRSHGCLVYLLRSTNICGWMRMIIVLRVAFGRQLAPHHAGPNTHHTQRTWESSNFPAKKRIPNGTDLFALCTPDPAPSPHTPQPLHPRSADEIYGKLRMAKEQGNARIRFNTNYLYMSRLNWSFCSTISKLLLSASVFRKEISL